LLTADGVGVMVGAGIHLLVGAVAVEAGAWAPLSFLLAGFVAVPTELSYAEFSARLPEAAVKALLAVAVSPCNLEYDLTQGQRGQRDDHLEALLCELTGAEAATVVNNNAAAVVLVLNTLCRQREALISRGELVEIGGSFRMPDVMLSANSILREVGTTNRTHLRDYAQAISDRTGVIMKVHTSNYEIQGYTDSVDEAELAALAKERGVPFVSDLGSGCLIDLRQFGLPHEPTVASVLAAGADVVTFSGDKLLGGPQAGLIAGRRDLIEQIRRNPLKRALRIDKLTTAALAAVLALYRDPATLAQQLPLLVDLTRSLEDIEAMAQSLLPAMRKALEGVAEVEIDDCQSQIGSGSLPVERLPTRALVMTPVAGKGERDAALLQLAAAFRALPRPVIGRIHDGCLHFDLRCLSDEAALKKLLKELKLTGGADNLMK